MHPRMIKKKIFYEKIAPWNNFSTALSGQSTHEALVKKSGLRRILW